MIPCPDWCGTSQWRGAEAHFASSTPEEDEATPTGFCSNACADAGMPLNKVSGEIATLRAAARRALAASAQWRDETRALSLAALEEIGPVDLDACSAEELDDIAAWANGQTEAGMPAHLAAYLGTVRDATR